ncbi:hypothetical protein GCM10022255_041250 [Dactylosporangium darangshiense]|uniref:Uncharacterized protein n=1 Tax=Dactylosporangium darangshiense TaxID=579108 RepID=A0ABP8DAG6_9ACTN
MDDWRLVRRYAVPEWMVAECAEARKRGDWRAACEAARVDVGFDEAGPAAELLAGFAPDLLRWHLPRSRSGSAALAAGMRYVLAPDGPVDPGTVVLEVRSPLWTSSSQRLTLDAVRAGEAARSVAASGPSSPGTATGRACRNGCASTGATCSGAWSTAAAGWCSPSSIRAWTPTCATSRAGPCCTGSTSSSTPSCCPACSPRVST